MNDAAMQRRAESMNVLALIVKPPVHFDEGAPSRHKRRRHRVKRMPGVVAQLPRCSRGARVSERYLPVFVGLFAGAPGSLTASACASSARSVRRMIVLVFFAEFHGRTMIFLTVP